MSDPDQSHAIESVVDDVLIGELLESLHAPPDRTGTLADKALRAIDEPTIARDPQVAELVRRYPVSRLIRSTWFRMTCAIVSLAGLLLILELPTGTGNRAEATILAALANSELQIDHTYNVSWRGRLMPPGQRRTATLYVRAGSFVVENSSSDRGLFDRLGYDGEIAWMIPRTGPVLIWDESRKSKAMTQLVEIDAEWTNELMSIRSLLQRFVEFYDREVVDVASLHKGEPDRWLQCRGRLKSPHPMLPPDVEVWVDETSGLVGRLELRWNKHQLLSPLSNLDLSFEHTSPLPAAWYSHQYHRDPSRDVEAF